MTFAELLWLYQAERFPLKKTVPLLAVFSAASINVSAFLSGRALPGTAAYAVGFALAFILFFQMRAADEWKDRDIDAAYRPERPIPRGVIQLDQVIAIALGLAPLAVLIAMNHRIELLWLLGGCWVWFAAMTYEFGVKEWLVARPVVYLVSHMAIMPLIDLLLTGVEWAGRFTPSPQLWIFLTLSLVNGCVLEIGRKCWAPEAEREGVESYSSLWGPGKAVFVWAAFVMIAALLLVLLGQALERSMPFAIVAGLSCLGCLAIALRFRAAPTGRHQGWVNAAAGLWVLICYGAAGFLPLVIEAAG